jgi:bifunctional enzyme CysN/CysC
VAMRGCTVWFTGLSGAGKSTIATRLVELLGDAGVPAYHLDADVLRTGINRDLGYDAASRQENVRRLAEIAALFADAGMVAVVSSISPYDEGRRHARDLHHARGLGFLLAFVDTPVEVCAKRDAKGLYALSSSGNLPGLTGVDAPYEVPSAADVVLRPDDGTAEDLAQAVLRRLSALVEEPISLVEEPITAR